jgi:hypothetical protein
VSRNEKVIEELKKKYGVSSLEEFEEKIMKGEVNPSYPGDFSVEDDWLLWSDLEYKAEKEDKARHLSAAC